MTMHEASRTLLKSPPELWAECSDAASLNRHLDSFGEIRITRLEPETAVAWEGDTASGTVRLEPSGWGTRVILTAVGAVAAGEETVSIGDEAEPEAAEREVAEPEVAAETDVAAPEAVGPEPAEPELVTPEPVTPEPVEPEPVAPEPVLDARPEPAAPEPVQTTPRGGFLARIKAWMRGPEPVAAELEPPTVGQAVPEVEPLVSVGDPVAPEPVAREPEPALAPAEPEPVIASVADEPTPADALTHALDSLGMAHHRPFSRS